MKKSNVTINDVLETINLPLGEDQVYNLLFDVTRYYDKKFVSSLKITQENGKKFNRYERENLRKYYYHGEVWNKENISPEYKFRYKKSTKDKKRILNYFDRLIDKYDQEKIVNSLRERYLSIYTLNEEKKNCQKWLDFYYKKNKKYEMSSLIINFNDQIFKENGENLSFFYNYIDELYDKLQNYHHLVVVFDGKITKKNAENHDLTWELIWKIAIYLENFKSFSAKFPAFKKTKEIKSFTDFIFSKKNDCNVSNFDAIKEEINRFYQDIHYGFQFQDCLVSNDEDKKILVFQKIELDEEKIPCPSCLEFIESSNSYPVFFLKSWECKNVNCPERSKSGRGKRFDEYGSFRYFKMIEDNENDKISSQLYKEWRRDIFDKNFDWFEMILSYYTWSGETIGVINLDNLTEKIKGRHIKKIHPEICRETTVKDLTALPIYNLFSIISKNWVSYRNEEIVLKNKIEIVNTDSTFYLNKLKSNQIGAAITSPPYYNAREYSQWKNMLHYLVDMMKNAESVFNSLSEDNFYLYNIGDIVSQDNIYVNSHMSNRRQMLGFYSCLIFDIVGFKLVGNIIWDKKEVQSKRNSTINFYPGYVKPINCYEHIFIFNKNLDSKPIDNSDYSYIFVQNPVIKINNKGENKIKHTAPYPMNLVTLIEPFVKEKTKYILDPFLGSGTTSMWCRLNGFKSIGIEKNKEYFLLAKKNIGKTMQDNKIKD